jgi:hypothetical protein
VLFDRTVGGTGISSTENRNNKAVFDKIRNGLAMLRRQLPDRRRELLSLARQLQVGALGPNRKLTPPGDGQPFNGCRHITAVGHDELRSGKSQFYRSRKGPLAFPRPDVT